MEYTKKRWSHYNGSEAFQRGWEETFGGGEKASLAGEVDQEWREDFAKRTFERHKKAVEAELRRPGGYLAALSRMVSHAAGESIDLATDAGVTRLLNMLRGTK